MTLPDAVFYSECILSFGWIIQSLEYFFTPNAPRMTAAIIFLTSIMLILHVSTVISEVILVLMSISLIYQYHGPYNGGSDCIATLLIISLTITNIIDEQYYKELAISYFCAQLIYSYFQSGYVKLLHSEWRNGSALENVFLVTSYPTTDSIRDWGNHHKLLFTMGWFVIIFELIFPLAITNKTLLIIALIIATVFHLANAFLFGLNRFFWMWISGYPLLIWFQERIFY